MRIVIVDDEAEIRASLLSLCVEEGYTVVLAPDGLAALDLLRRLDGPSVVILDLMMPRLDGEQVLHAIWDDRELRQRTAFILMTASPRSITREFAALLARLEAVPLAKPPDSTEMLDHIAAAAQRLERGEASLHERRRSGTSGLRARRLVGSTSARAARWR
jgi:CheY-like chemotaxis protein